MVVAVPRHVHAVLVEQPVKGRLQLARHRLVAIRLLLEIRVDYERPAHAYESAMHMPMQHINGALFLKRSLRPGQDIWRRLLHFEEGRSRSTGLILGILSHMHAVLGE